jgi:hypothetical protein
MSRFWRLERLWLSMLFGSGPLYAQMPFYTDDPAVTEPKKLHVEIFDEFDGLQSSQFPDLRQNTANFKINYSPLRTIEVDVDAPYLTISRTAGAETSRGVGDTNLGAKWNLRETPPDTLLPALAVSFYVEFPTGDSRQELGSGLTDYWLNFILQKPLSEATRINVNLGLLFAGNTSTGAVGIQTRRGQVYTGGISLLHDATSRVTWGGEVYGGISDGAGSDKTQLQAMLGVQYAIRDGLSLCVGVLGGKYGATPQIGGQIGVSIDFPDVLGSSARPPH